MSRLRNLLTIKKEFRPTPPPLPPPSPACGHDLSKPVTPGMAPSQRPPGCCLAIKAPLEVPSAAKSPLFALHPGPPTPHLLAFANLALLHSLIGYFLTAFFFCYEIALSSGLGKP